MEKGEAIKIKKEKPLAHIVLGMHRSGTSMLSRTLNLIGLKHARELVDPSESNPLGHWEPLRVVEINDSLLSKLDREWADPKPLPVNWEKSEHAHSTKIEALDWLKSEFGSVDNITLKDPRMSRLVPIWQSAIASCGGKAAYLIICRNPLEVAASLMKRDKISLEYALQLWLSYMLEIEAGTRGLPRVVIHYQNFILDWRSTLKNALSAIVSFDEKMLKTHQKSIDSFITQNQQNHSFSDSELSTRDDIPQIIKDCYELYIQDPLLGDAEKFNQLLESWKTEWNLISPGSASSNYIQEFPGWQIGQSLKYLEQGNLDEAILAARKANKLNPDDAQYRNHLANLLINSNMLEEAVVELNCAVKLDDNVPDFHITLSHILNRLEQVDGAISAANAAVTLCPNDADLYQHLANLLHKAGRDEELTDALARINHLNSNS